MCYTILHSHQQRMRVPVAPHPCQHLILSVFWISNRCVMVPHCCHNLQFPGNIQCGAFFHVLIANYISLLMRCLFRPFAHFLMRLLIFFFSSFKNSLYIYIRIYVYIYIYIHIYIHIYTYIYIYMAALGLCCCPRAFSSCGERGLLFIAVRGLLIAVASLVAEHGLLARRLSSYGSRA